MKRLPCSMPLVCLPPPSSSSLPPASLVSSSAPVRSCLLPTLSAPFFVRPPSAYLSPLDPSLPPSGSYRPSITRRPPHPEESRVLNNFHPGSITCPLLLLTT